MPSPAFLAVTNRRRTRSVGFLDHGTTRWACYLVTYRASATNWRGYLAFRAERSDGIRVVRTAEIFLESNEAEIDRKARNMGRPLLTGLLSSALEVEESNRQKALSGSEVRGWVHEALRERACDVPATSAEDVARIRSRYESYRIDQLTHLVALMEQSALEALVGELLEGASFQFGARDRLQFAMLVVQRLEALLPLPPLEVFLEDCTQNPVAHERYHHDLYAGGELP